jgi:hypothetical protein
MAIQYGGAFGDMGMGIPQNAPTGGRMPPQYRSMPRGLETRGTRPRPGARVGGRPLKVRGGSRSGMGMGIPQGAPTGGGMPPQYARNYAGAFGDMGMGIPQNAPTGGGMPAQYVKPQMPVQTPVSMGATRNKRAPIKAPPPKAPPKAPIKKTFMSGKGLAIGAGAAVIAGLAMNRRGDGTSSGRSGMTRY